MGVGNGDTISRRARSEIRDARLVALGFSDYRDYINSAAWRAKKAAYRESDLPQGCVLCDATEPIVFHHRTYDRVGEEELADLAPLCPGCHGMVHQLEESGLTTLADIEWLRSEKRAAEYAPAAARRHVEARASFQSLHDEDQRRRRMRNLTHRLRQVVIKSAHSRVDISSQLFVIERQIEKAEKKVERGSQ